MSQLNHGTMPTPQQQAQTQAAIDTAEDLQHVNDDAAAARHLTAIRIRGQLADAEGEAAQG
ncbi:hypothetical protein [Herbaspirillum robiniae]|uniref:Uncharacterized protein n=1 Tax=Herbaspirillum robiniae TaxID=2014887 RepID=A0A246WUZ7_9BURK|nr:hypothetical protein [Herbaspirillum robiniae]NUU01464.1 hypothetical protein [Herbaspirillum robiniae]OWY30521.1 hypothetical protein CEJ42_00045 [Herbaspirillum robiniae]